MSSIRAAMESLVHDSQTAICDALAALDGGAFATASWERPGGGGGRSRVLQEGRVFEKAGVNVSVVHGALSPEAMRSMRPATPPRTTETAFYATGLSMVVHPVNPFAPTMHANLRYFDLDGGGTWWFGGSADLTPAYLFEDDARDFHRAFKEVCDRHDPDFYARFKPWCDSYFHLPHRGEHRGVGGLFWDDLADRAPEALLAFHADIAAVIAPTYVPIVSRRMQTAYTDRHVRWQRLRRGRYVEFNLVYDRGTVFGLRTGARTDSVLMSLPLHARWEVGDEPAPDTPEAELLQVLRSPRSWA